MQSPQEPSPDELLAMAYVDGELDHEARRVFESRLAGEAGLAPGRASCATWKS
ncbi:MAG: hypothetical protein R3F17_13250 [Planctomycetota bacterium]